MLNQEKLNQILKYFAQKIIAKYQPFVIGVTGSVGKTSTRHAIAAALSARFSVREPIKNYNNAIGIPLTVIGARGLDENKTVFDSGALGWLRIFAKALSVWLLPQNYPKVLVLEYGIDHPGDMDDLVSIVQPQLSVLTTVGISHKEFFNTEAEIAFEKGKIAANLPVNGTFVYNADDANVSAQTNRTKGNLLSFSMSGQGNVNLVSAEETLQLNPSTKLNIKTPTREISVTIPVIGAAHVSAVLAAVTVAEAMEVETDLILKGLASYICN